MRLLEGCVFLRGCEFPSECILFLQINMCLLKYPHGPYYRPIILAQKTWHFYVFTEPDFYLHFFFQNLAGLPRHAYV